MARPRKEKEAPKEVASFKYIGKEGSTVAFGLTFHYGQAVAVSDAHAINKLRGNHHFEEVGAEDEE